MLRSFSELAPPQPFFCVRTEALFGMIFVRGAKGIGYGVNWALNSGIRSFTRRNFGTSTKGLLKIVQCMQEIKWNKHDLFDSENLGAILKCYITRFSLFQQSHYWQWLKIIKVARAALGTVKVTDWVLELFWLVLCDPRSNLGGTRIFFSVLCLYSSYKIIGDALPSFHLTQPLFKL